MRNMIRLFSIEDDIDFIYLLQKMFDGAEDIEFLGYADNKKDGIQRVKELNPDVVLVDLSLPEGHLEGIEASKEIRIATDSKILLLTCYEQIDTVIDRRKQKGVCVGLRI